MATVTMRKCDREPCGALRAEDERFYRLDLKITKTNSGAETLGQGEYCSFNCLSMAINEAMRLASAEPARREGVVHG